MSAYNVRGWEIISIVTASRKQGAFLPTEKEISTMKEKICKVWTTVFEVQLEFCYPSNGWFIL